MARLNIMSGKRLGDVLVLDPGTYQVGTKKSADIQLRDKGVGFKHAQLIVEDGHLYVEDLKSRGGTFLNGVQLEANAAANPPRPCERCTDAGRAR